MKYESELIKEIVDSRGHEKSSLHYQSECVESWIEESKGAYPKLCDYESEWLNYIIDDEPIGEFPYLALTDVTEATVDNVVPYAYKSAILKGKTLVNNVQSIKTTGTYTTIHNNGIGFTINTNGETTTSRESFTLLCTNKITAGAKYTVIVDVAENTITRENDSQQVLKIVLNDYNKVGSGYLQLNIGETGLRVFEIITSSDTTANNPYMETPKDINGRLIVNGISIIEGHNHNLTGFIEGMQTVQMPGLTTTGKNLFDVNKFKNISIDENGYYFPTKFVDKDDYVTLKLKPNTKYSVLGTYISDGTSSIFYRIENNGSYRTLNTDFDTNSTGITNIKIGSNSYDVSNPRKVEKIMIVESTLKDIYEPHQSNILTVNEDVALRSNGNVYDELDLLTGKLTQRIDEDGSVLTQEVVKTVDLTVVNQDGESMSKIKPIEGTMHLSTSSDTIPPLFSGEIPVEAITQNLASFIDLETEE